MIIDEPSMVSDKPLPSFSDISEYWAEANIKQAVRARIVNGYPDGTFKPKATVTQAEFVVMLMNALKPQAEGNALTFTDSAKIGAWAQKSISQAVQAGLIHGYEDGSLRPDAEITPAEMAVVIAKALGQSDEANAAVSFADDRDIPAWAKGSVAFVQKKGIVQGKSNNIFAPQKHATRAEAVTVLLNMLAQMN
ncbi:S-layer homology domain-containing protein [Paenibacillus sp. N3.4]|uniref:S-layer homology domain-containing protein n=1 Tax=Paenibacillus sp. N3.4 TaxID=2603222 RepID=UPI0021C2CD8A|nr:S-layer homology domain-containing protein [Paenibacillus sp. N3.4]